MGLGNNGEFGLGDLNSHSVPVQIQTGGVLQMAAGSNHTLFLKSDGSLWGMGYNNYAELGLGHTNTDISTPQQIEANGVVAVSATKLEGA